MANRKRGKKLGSTMTKNMVTSPAGELIEIVSDDDWLAITGAGERGLRTWMAGTKRHVFAELWLGGEVSDPKSGMATGKLWTRMRERFGDEITTQPTSFNGLANDPLNAPAIERTKNGKRTYLIKLIALPELWYGRVLEMIDAFEDNSPIDPEPEPIPEPSQEDRAAAVRMESEIFPTPTDEEFSDIIRGIELDAPTVYESEPPLEIAMASQVAMSLLTTVVEIIAAGSTAAVDERVKRLQGDMADISQKLGSRLEENDRLRRQLRSAGDEITALRHERDGLRSRLRATEANLTAALKGDAVQAINGEIQRRVESIMRVSPKAKGDE